MWSFSVKVPDKGAPAASAEAVQADGSAWPSPGWMDTSGGGTSAGVWGDVDQVVH